MTTPRRGLSLTEVLVVMSIVLLLASLAYPALMKGIESAKISRSRSNMRQLHVALTLYVNDQDGEGPNRLGLPHCWQVFIDSQHIPTSLLRTGGTGWQQGPGRSGGDAYTWMVPNVLPGFPGYSDLPGSERYKWLRHVEATQGNPVLLLDATFPLRTGWMESKRLFGLYFDGHIETRTFTGNVTDHQRWE